MPSVVHRLLFCPLRLHLRGCVDVRACVSCGLCAVRRDAAVMVLPAPRVAAGSSVAWCRESMATLALSAFSIGFSAWTPFGA